METNEIASNLGGALGDEIQLFCQVGFKFKSNEDIVTFQCMADKEWNTTTTCVRK